MTEGGGGTHTIREIHTRFWLKNLKKRDSLEGLSVDEG